VKERENKIMSEEKSEGQRRFEEYWAKQMADPEYRRIYEEESQKKDLWLQLVEARYASGLTQQQVAERMGVSQAQVARIEKQGYDAYTLRTLRRYLEALGDDFRLEVVVKKEDVLKELQEVPA